MRKLNKKNTLRLQEWQQQAKAAFEQGQFELCKTLSEKILKLQPNHPDSLHLLGLVAFRAGNNDEALQLISKAVNEDARSAVYLGNYGMVLNNAGRFDEAIVCLQKALALSPNTAPLYNNLGFAYTRAGATRESVLCYQKAVQLAPNYAEGFNNLGMALTKLGRFDEAISAYRKALELNPAFHLAFSNLLFLLSYYCMVDAAQILAEHRRWDEVYGSHQKQFPHQFGIENCNRTKLRIGYFSSDFRRHPVSTFIEPLLAHHHKDRVEVYCYAEVFAPDEVTERLITQADHWYSTVKKSDEEVARQINSDQIDILVDLNGHTAYNRLKVFTYKPAPIQVTYLGYCTTTGLSAMDYWLTDVTLHPADTKELASEQIYRLPRCWVTYQPAEGGPDVMQRADDAPLTLGSLNDIRKLSDETVAAWASILNKMPNAVLLLKSKQLSDEQEQQAVRERFASNGISSERLDLRGASPFPDYLQTYNEIDIALDTFPRSGGTTAADALWMGVPVVTLMGGSYVERLAASKLVAIGREEWIASTLDEYNNIVVSLSNDAEKRKQLRVQQRDQMANSPLCDAEGLAMEIENAYFQMWYRKNDCC